MLKRYDKYREIDDFWIKEIPVLWNAEQMKYLFEEISEKNHPEEKTLVASQHMGVVPKDIYGLRTVLASKGLESFKLVKVGDFVISLRSFQGGIEYAYYQGIISPAYTILRGMNKIESNYFKYLAKSYAYIALLKICVTGIREGQNIDYGILKKHLIPVPPKSEQDKIVQFIDWKTSEMNRFIHQKKKQIKLLEELKQTIINRFIFSGIHNEEKKQTGFNWIPDIPKNWGLLKAKFLFEEIVDTGYGNELPLLSITNKDGVIPQSETGRKKRMSEVTTSYKRIKPGDIGYNLMNAFIGSLGVSKYDGLISPAYAVCRPIIKMCSKYFEYVYRTPQFMQEFDNNSYGIMIERNRLYFDNFKQIVTPVPPYEEQLEIVEYLEAKLSEVDEMISGINKEITLVEELRTKLISDVVTGQVDVRDVKIPAYETETDIIDSEEDSDEENQEESME
ncbi:restriction endonuclease subunit S [uncultured Clostridium sp.]|uniref:restriction endonuclease subunit S n=1 Tax=uncultured Clostridium sp. TaxID=59620 RepID=UPI0025FA5F20|nr:restriction endonuclease subunit S [uncultured Clostridium sp.]